MRRHPPTPAQIRRANALYAPISRSARKTGTAKSISGNSATEQQLNLEPNKMTTKKARPVS
jgi:hypothetical protein